MENWKEERLIRVLIKSAFIDYLCCGSVHEVHPGAGPCCAWGCMNTKQRDGPHPKGWHTLFTIRIILQRLQLSEVLKL